jgi:hypothetical protein
VRVEKYNLFNFIKNLFKLTEHKVLTTSRLAPSDCTLNVLTIVV